MNNVNTQASRDLTAITSEQLQQLYCDNWQTIISDVAVDYPALGVTDLDAITDDFATQLYRYGGPASDAAFRAWARDVMRGVIVTYLYATCEKFVDAGVWKGLKESRPNYFADYNGIAPDISQKVWAHVFLHLRRYLSVSPTGAKVSTRLHDLAEEIARNWIYRQARRRKIVTDRIRKVHGEDHLQQVMKKKFGPDATCDPEHVGNMRLGSMAEDL